MSGVIEKYQFRICVPASDAIDGGLGYGVKEILSLRTGERVQIMYYSLAWLT